MGLDDDVQILLEVVPEVKVGVGDELRLEDDGRFLLAPEDVRLADEDAGGHLPRGALHQFDVLLLVHPEPRLQRQERKPGCVDAEEGLFHLEPDRLPVVQVGVDDLRGEAVVPQGDPGGFRIQGFLDDFLVLLPVGCGLRLVLEEHDPDEGIVHLLLECIHLLLQPVIGGLFLVLGAAVLPDCEGESGKDNQ